MARGSPLGPPLRVPDLRWRSRERRRREYHGETQYRWTQGEPLLVEIETDYDGDGIVDSGARQHWASGRWLTWSEMIGQGGSTWSTDVYAYDPNVAGRLMTRENIFGSGVSDTYAWSSEGTLSAIDYGAISGVSCHVIDNLFYDAELLVRRRVYAVCPTEIYDQRVDIEWVVGRIATIRRFDNPSNRMIERWSFTRGCEGDRAADVDVWPITSFKEELVLQPVDVDRSKTWLADDYYAN
jgi:hypothetical protein